MIGRAINFDNKMLQIRKSDLRVDGEPTLDQVKQLDRIVVEVCFNSFKSDINTTNFWNLETSNFHFIPIPFAAL